jgi:HK97 family phage major capsid protein
MYDMIVRLLLVGLAAVTRAVPPLPSVVKWNETTYAKRVYGKAIAGGKSGGVFGMVRAVLSILTPRRLVLAAMLVALLVVPDMGAELLLANVVPVTIESQKAKLDEMFKQMEGIKSKYAGQVMPQAEGEKYDQLAVEAKGLQDDLDMEYRRAGRFEELKAWGGQIEAPTLPAPDAKQRPVGDLAGYMSLGEYVINSKAVAEFVNRGAPDGSSARVEFESGLLSALKHGGRAWVPVTHEQAKAFHEAWESKAVPTIGTGVVEATRLPGITQVQKDDELVIRQMFAQGQTTSDQVEYVRRNGTTRAAAETAHGAAKPEAAMTFDLATSPVRTIAAWMPVQTQQLADFGQLRSEIDNFLLYDLGKRVDEQLIYGLGTGVELEGVTVVSGTTDIAANGRYDTSTHTFIDVVRMGITDVSVQNYTPNAVLIHPFDWETIELEKGTDNRYVWVVVTTENGSRLWGLQVVSSNSMEANAGDTTEARNIIVGDFLRGATVADRMQAAVSVGVTGSQFTSNLRTILAEERLAFPIRAPAAFATFETQAAVT